MDWIPADIGALSPLLALGFGVVVGIMHAFEPDHMAAVGTQAVSQTTRSKRYNIRDIVTKSSILGAVWGAGHTTTLALFGMLVYATASLIQSWVFAGFEMAAGLMLLALGFSAILGRGILWPAHKHHHTHTDGTAHTHTHRHDDAHHKHTHRSYIIGLVHGLAGSGALIALTAATMDTPDMMLMFILVFGTGSILGMCVAGGLLGIPLALASRKRWAHKLVRYGAGALSIIIGVMVIYNTGVIAPL